MDRKLHKQGPRGFKAQPHGPRATSALGHPDNVERDDRETEISAQVAKVRARILADFPGAQFPLQRPTRPLTEDEMDQIVEEACTALAEGVSSSDWEGEAAPAPPPREEDWRAAIDRVAYRRPGESR